MIRAAVATPESDARLCKQYRKLGYRARRNSVKREECPYDGMLKGWWLQGWDSLYSDEVAATS